MHTLDYANKLIVDHRTGWYFWETQKTFMVVRPCQKPTTTGRTSKFAIVMKFDFAAVCVVKEFARTLQTGMSCLLSNNFPHRDLKVSNVLIIVCIFPISSATWKVSLLGSKFRKLGWSCEDRRVLESSREFTYEKKWYHRITCIYRNMGCSAIKCYKMWTGTYPFRRA